MWEIEGLLLGRLKLREPVFKVKQKGNIRKLSSCQDTIHVNTFSSSYGSVIYPERRRERGGNKLEKMEEGGMREGEWGIKKK